MDPSGGRKGGRTRPEAEGNLPPRFEGALGVAVPALLVLVALLYSSRLSDYMSAKWAAVHLVGALVVGLWLAGMAAARRLRLRSSSLYLPFLVYILIGLLHLPWTQNGVRGAEVLLGQGWLFLLCIVVAHRFRSAPAALVLLWTMVLTGLVVALLGCLQYNHIHLIPFPKAYGKLPISTLGNLNFVAHYQEIVFLLAVALLALRRRFWERLVLGVALLASGVHMVLSASRAGWLALLVGLLFWLYVQLRKARWTGAVMPVLVGVLLLSPAAGLVLESVHLKEGPSLRAAAVRMATRTWERALSSFDRREFSISQRLLIWQDSLDLIRSRALVGVGPGNYAYFLPAYRSQSRQRAWRELMGRRVNIPYHAHNEYLEVFAEEGLFGLAAMLWLLGTVLWLGRGVRRTRSEPEIRAIALGCTAALIAVLVHSFFSFNLQDPTSAAHFWCLAGLLAGLNRPSGDQDWLLSRPLRSPGGRLGILGASLGVVLVGLYMGLRILLGDYYYFQGLQEHRLAHPNRATLAFRRAIAWRGCDFVYHHMLGLSSMEAGRYAEAQRALARSLELHPYNGGALGLLGQVLLERGRAGEAVPVLERAVSVEPFREEGYLWLARAHRRLGEHRQALKAWKQALDLRPGDAQLLMSLGQEYSLAGQMEAASLALERALRVAPRDEIIQGNLGTVYLQQGRLDKAEAALRQAFELAPTGAQAWRWRFYLADLYSRRQRWAAALAAVEEALRLNPGERRVQEQVRELRRRLEER